MSRPDSACDTINLVAATVDTRFGVIEHAIFCPDLVDSRAPTRGIVFTEHVLKIAGQQTRYAIGHNGSVFTIANLSAVPNQTAMRVRASKIRRDVLKQGCMARIVGHSSIKPKPPFQNKSGVFATTPCRGLSLSR
jgi:hypothetical protein